MGVLPTPCGIRPGGPSIDDGPTELGHEIQAR